MNKLVVSGVLLFVLTEVFCVVALLSPDWIVSNFAGQTKLGLTIACHSAPEGDLLCDFPTPHPAWLVTALLIAVGVVIFALTVVFLAVSLKRNNRTFEKAAKWMALIGTIILCIASSVFPVGFAMEELGSRAYLLPQIYSVGYSYIFFNLAIISSIVAQFLTYRLFSPR